MKLRGRFWKLSEPLISMAILVESIKATFTKVAPLITRETYRIASTELKYDNQKIRSATGYRFRTAQESIDDLCTCFLDTYADQKYGILEIS